MEKIRSLSTLLTDLQSDVLVDNDHVNIKNIVKAFHERGFGMLIFIFALPIALPFPVPPGINSIFALPLILLTAQMIIGRHTVWFPQFILKRKFKKAKLDKVITLSVPWLKKIEYFIKPRLGFLTQRTASHIVGILGFIMAASIYVPIPLTNTVPGMGMCAMAIGLIMRDGLAVFAGAVVGGLWAIGVFAVLFLFGMEGLHIVRGWF